MPLFDPTADASLVVKLLGSTAFRKGDATACADGDLCATWVDPINGYNAIQSSAGNAPTLPIYRANAVNGLPGLDFSVGPSYGYRCLTITQAALNTVQTSAHTVIVVGTAGASDGFILGNGALTDTVGSLVWGVNNGVVVYETPSLTGGPIPTTGQLQVYGRTWDPSVTSVNGVARKYYNGSLIATAIGGNVNVTTAPITIGADRADGYTPWKGRVLAFLMFNRALTPAEHMGAAQYFYTLYNRPWPALSGPALVVWNGNSISADGIIIADAIALMSGYSRESFVNLSWGSKTTQNMNTYIQEETDLYAVMHSYGLPLVNIGWELSNGGALSDYTTYANAVRALGYKHVAATTLPRSNNIEATRIPNNASIRLNYRGYANSIADCGGDALMGQMATTSDVSKYGDGVHPTPAGKALIAPYFAYGIQGVFASARLGTTLGCGT